jgi:tripartite-type tricarboxylate transporter receptor subunit TctC
MKTLVQFALGFAALSASAIGPNAPARAQSLEFYAGKTLTVIVGLSPGGTVDTFARRFATYLRKNIPGNPAIVIQNMPGGAGLVATNYVFERARPDGLTILWNPWDPLGQALGDQGLRARYEKFGFIGGTGDIRVNYARTDVIPDGLKKPSDIARAKELVIGTPGLTDQSGLLAKLSLDVLHVPSRLVLGYRGGNEIFLALERGEVNFHNTSITTFRTRNADLIKSGKAIGVNYFVPVDESGNYERSKSITDMPPFPDLFREIHGRMPSGPTWDALNWLTNQIGEMTYVGLAPPGTPAEALAVLRKGYEAASNDPEFVEHSIATNGLPYGFVGVQRGEAIFRSLSEVTPEVLAVLRQTIERK